MNRFNYFKKDFIKVKYLMFLHLKNLYQNLINFFFIMIRFYHFKNYVIKVKHFMFLHFENLN